MTTSGLQTSYLRTQQNQQRCGFINNKRKLTREKPRPALTVIFCLPSQTDKLPAGSKANEAEEESFLQQTVNLPATVHIAAVCIYVCAFSGQDKSGEM